MQQIDLCVSVLAFVARHHFAAELVGHEVQAITDAQHRHAEMQHALIGGRSVGVIDRRWASRKNDAAGLCF